MTPSALSNETVIETLKPFAALGQYLIDQGFITKPDDAAVWGFDNNNLTYGDFRKAAALITELQSYRSEGWQPIETAPKDGKAFLVWCPDRFNMYLVIARFGLLEHFGPGADPLREKPTLWQPLPEPPRALNASGSGERG